ncbi:MAG: DUF1572 domain-containing protein [Pedobacter sp.]|uniref:DUF1572 domain-containing protein n=1 Tax=Pedobacter sp. TaxID=1411316 RepID=UPI00280680FE|nr:DUF1572 domain-containing protein [Pedobacter sp.]MDQ8006186.1 DUF1572 domain-containing protein [Pedobacter sp.]
MNHAKQLASRFKEVILNGTWIANTNYKDQLDGLDWQIAVKPVQNLNTIAVLAQHIHYYIKGVKEVFKGAELTIKDHLSFDFEPITSQVQWDAFLTKFWEDAEEFTNLVAQLSETQLSEYFVEEKYSTYLRNVDSMIEHSYYHLGQIVLIKKMLIS